MITLRSQCLYLAASLKPTIFNVFPWIGHCKYQHLTIILQDYAGLVNTHAGAQLSCFTSPLHQHWPLIALLLEDPNSGGFAFICDLAWEAESDQDSADCHLITPRAFLKSGIAGPRMAGPHHLT